MLETRLESYYDSMEDYLPSLGRVLLGVFFYFQGVTKITGGFSGFASYVESLGFPAATFFAGLAVSVEIVGGLALVAGFRSKVVGLIVSLYLLVVNMVAYQFWISPDQLSTFMKNIGLIGGLILLTKTGSGSCSLDFCMQNVQEDSS